MLSDIPVLGPALFNGNIFVYLAPAPGRGRSTSGCSAPGGACGPASVGEHPAAADTVGVKVLGLRYRNVLLGGLVAGLGGAYFTLAVHHSFNKNMTSAARASSRWPR